MNVHEAGRLLAYVGTVDSKFPQPDDGGLVRRVWADFLDDVPYGAARRAVRAYYRSEAYASHRETIAPADIVGWWHARRRPTEDERTGTTATNRRSLPAPPRDPDRIRAGVDTVRAALLARTTPRATRAEAADTVAQQRTLRAHPCSHCGAREDQPCVDVRGNRLTKSEAHPSRATPTEPTPRGTADQARTELTTGATP